MAKGSVYVYTRPDNQTISLGCYPAGYTHITSLFTDIGQDIRQRTVPLVQKHNAGKKTVYSDWSEPIKVKTK